jgi:DNA-binding NarL/FixJ family response regulator
MLPVGTSLKSPTATPSPMKVPAPIPLSAHEVEVLRFVAQELTNAQIAERLIISRIHMRSRYSKIRVNSHIALMRYAPEHHLA